MAEPNLAIIKTEDYKGPDRRAPQPLKAYDKTIVNSAARLPPIGHLAQGIVALAVNNLDAKEVAALSMHLTHTCRESSITKSREAGAEGTVNKGDHVKLVRVSTVSASYEGMVGVVQKVSKVRCYVKVRGYARPLYVYMSEVEKVTQAQYKKLLGLPSAANDGGAAAKKKTTPSAKSTKKTSAKKGSAPKAPKKASGKKSSTKKVAPEAAPEADTKAA